MNNRTRTISRGKLPGRIDRTQQKTLLNEFKDCISADHPCAILDCSMLEQLDRPAIQFLLSCLEEAMKRNGDVRLAALQPGTQATFLSIGLDKLFQVFDCVADVEESYRIPHISLVPLGLPAINQENVKCDAA